MASPGESNDDNNFRKIVEQAQSADHSEWVTYEIGVNKQPFDLWLKDNLPSTTTKRQLTIRKIVEQAQSADHSEWVTYEKGVNKQPFDLWLKDNLPSKILKSNGFGWIAVRNEDNNIKRQEEDLEGLSESWDKLQILKTHIDKETVWRLAKEHGCTTGKWMYWIKAGVRADAFWTKIATAIMTGTLIAKTAKISPYPLADEEYNHVCCIYNKNFLDKEEVFKLEEGLRGLGLKGKLVYKPDVYTYLEIYRNNPWRVKPCIYSSMFDLKSKKSSIKVL